jgi:pyruvate/2-oxoglutarate dehydrogenase complex dihydrolipoamide acyltransferase (E2) component
VSEGLGKYRRTPEKGFRKFAMAFWDPPRDGSIYGQLRVDVSRMQQFQADCLERFGVKPSIGILVGRGIAHALNEVPEGNAKIIWGQAYLKDTVDVYYQVDIGDGKDLSGVVVPDVGRKTAIEVAQILRDKAKKLRGGEDDQYEKTQKGCLSFLPSWAMRRLLGFLTFLEYNLGITPSWLGARPEPFGTVMVSNLSKFGIDLAYAPLIALARVPFLALVGHPSLQPHVRDGELVVAPIATFTATFDHRLLDGSKIGRIGAHIREYCEDPYLFEAEVLGLETPPFPWELEAKDTAKSEGPNPEVQPGIAPPAEEPAADKEGSSE